MRLAKHSAARLQRLRLVFHQHPDEVLTVAAASALTALLATGLGAVRDAAVLAVALSACTALAYLGHCVSPRERLRRAVRIGLGRGEFYVAYQPVVDTYTRRCMGVEALLRWRHPRFGAGGPGVFMQEIENTSVAGALTLFVLREANSALNQLWFAQHWHVSVNICARHLMEERFVEDMCESAGPMLRRIVLELTERSCVERTPQVIDALSRLKRYGVRLSLDDFGTGFSNLDILGDFHFDLVKVDRRFLAMSGDACALFLRSVVALVHTLGAKVVAEGVETDAHHEVVQSSGVDLAQGYWYGKPMTVEQLGAFVSSRTPMENGRDGIGSGHEE
jgi:EAL domain-containing protein (putative c-di-GMP-specific phosphodiesterase class I)